MNTNEFTGKVMELSVSNMKAAIEERYGSGSPAAEQAQQVEPCRHCGGNGYIRRSESKPICCPACSSGGRKCAAAQQQAEPVAPQVAGLPDGDLPDSVIQAAAEALGDAYDCIRVWSAWGVGTMGPDDFIPVADDGDRVAEIARAVITAWRSSVAMPAAQQQDNRECGCGWRGAVEDCAWLGSVGPLCPNCHETTEEAAQPPAVAVPGVLRGVTNISMETVGGNHRVVLQVGTVGEMYDLSKAIRAMLAAAQKGGE